MEKSNYEKFHWILMKMQSSTDNNSTFILCTTRHFIEHRGFVFMINQSVNVSYSFYNFICYLHAPWNAHKQDVHINRDCLCWRSTHLTLDFTAPDCEFMLLFIVPYTQYVTQKFLYWITTYMKKHWYHHHLHITIISITHIQDGRNDCYDKGCTSSQSNVCQILALIDCVIYNLFHQAILAL